ncbi:hypothetical protein G6011_08692 [Alternaria panax]|uniref:DUF7918 domain-containing protein n=1 Tax=Alternaria panax TaxID=48097 RepID=A0AAD4IA06_9PLEO|nr:hypothetical protein G6011_08692 [Alternaria panax]
MADEDLRSMESLGSIRLEFDYGEVGQNLPRDAQYGLLERDSVSENAMKGDVKSLQTGAGTKHEVSKATVCDWKTESHFATFVFKYSNVQVLWVIPHSPSPLDATQATPTQTLSSLPNSMTPSVNLRSNTASATPALPHQNSIRTTPDDYEDLTDEEIIALVKHYRGNDQGLAAQRRRRLLVLLKHYEDKDTASFSIKQETILSEPRVRTKRESANDGAVRGHEKKRRTEVIVLDD